MNQRSSENIDTVNFWVGKFSILHRYIVFWYLSKMHAVCLHWGAKMKLPFLSISEARLQYLGMLMCVYTCTHKHMHIHSHKVTAIFFSKYRQTARLASMFKTKMKITNIYVKMRIKQEVSNLLSSKHFVEQMRLCYWYVNRYSTNNSSNYLNF